MTVTFYLRNKDLLEELKVSREKGDMTPKLARMLQLLCNKYSKRTNFVGYTYNEDMQAYAMMMIVRTWRSFDPAKSDNPFAFFTQCIKNSFIQFLNQEQRHRNIRDVLMIKQGLNPSHSFTEDYNSRGGDSGSYDDEQDFESIAKPETINRADERFGDADLINEDFGVEIEVADPEQPPASPD